MMTKGMASIMDTAASAQAICDLSIAALIMLIEDPVIVLHMVACHNTEARGQDHEIEVQVTKVITAAASMSLLTESIAVGTEQSCSVMLHLAVASVHLSLYYFACKLWTVVFCSRTF